MEPEVTVILPFYNAESTLERALNSIANQTFENFECLLIDNNSSDESMNIAKKWINNDQRFKLFEEKRQGVTFASNKGSSMAQGKFIARMDADDWAYPQRLQSQKIFLDVNKDYDAVAGLVKYVPHKENTSGFLKYVEWSNSVITYESIKLKQFIESPIINPTVMWRKAADVKFGNYKHGNFPEDYEKWLRWLSRGAKIHKLDTLLLKWVDSEKRLTRTNQVYSTEAFYQIKTKYLSDWLRKHNPFHPHVLIWGASRISRKRANLLNAHGICIDGFIDIHKKRVLEEQLIYYKDIPEAGSNFVLTYLNLNNKRARVQEYLHSKGFVEGVSYLMVS